MKLIIENVRSFVGRHEIPIKPLTILVGENSSGKSTLMACLHAACQYPEFPFRTRWNDPPYELGTFETIVSRGHGTSGTERFCIGIEEIYFTDSGVHVTFGQSSDRIVPTEFIINYRSVQLRAEVTQREVGAEPLASVSLSVEGRPVELERSYPYPLLGYDPIWSLMETVVSASGNKADEATSPAVFLANFWRMYELERPAAVSIGPSRPDPQRAYSVENARNVLGSSGFAETLMLHKEERFEIGTATRAGLFDSLAAFGKESGLFDRVDVRRIGTGGSRAIQVRVAIGRRLYDLTDVGYGVSQVLPVLINSFAIVRPSAMLIQQPEAHLHPQAQAALGSFFARLAQSGGPSLVLESHSDFILDRVRIEVAKSRLDTEKVQILYLEKTGNRTHVYPIRVDDCGNVVDAPPSYRQFFMREEMSLLTRTSRT